MSLEYQKERRNGATQEKEMFEEILAENYHYVEIHRTVHQKGRKFSFTV